jgi:hypothetical protein
MRPPAEHRDPGTIAAGHDGTTGTTEPYAETGGRPNVRDRVKSGHASTGRTRPVAVALPSDVRGNHALGGLPAAHGLGEALLHVRHLGHGAVGVAEGPLEPVGNC